MTKKEFSVRPDTIPEQWRNDAGRFSWLDFMTSIPEPVFVVTGWKSNGKENACRQSWSTFVGGGVDDFVCILGKVYTNGHMYPSLKGKVHGYLNGEFVVCDTTETFLTKIATIAGLGERGMGVSPVNRTSGIFVQFESKR